MTAGETSTMGCFGKSDREKCACIQNTGNLWWVGFWDGEVACTHTWIVGSRCCEAAVCMSLANAASAQIY